MTKYILHGGEASRQTEDNKKFFFEITARLPDHANILCVLYARKKEDWPEKFAKNKTFFSAAAPQKNFNFIVADEKPDTFIAQIKIADVIYLRGGNTHLLKSYLEKIDNLENIWKDKIVSGSSAGALVLSKYYYENDDDTYSKGLGILPFNIFCHFSKNDLDKAQKLKELGENLEVKMIPEEKFIIVKI